MVTNDSDGGDGGGGGDDDDDGSDGDGSSGSSDAIAVADDGVTGCLRCERPRQTLAVIHGVHIEPAHEVKKRSISQPLRILLSYDESVFRSLSLIRWCTLDKDILGAGSFPSKSSNSVSKCYPFDRSKARKPCTLC
ncbi:hypothetical protein HZH66_005933 [Vespula vulgaris]|uniref:Uncharacterized protein n=1 Tax=Vespula vulgaris TaxID=7454 RepID=A0A834K5C4_VESVU|nr:hypothetical protein HZH66_005933 [Vespula vulgaris]